MTLFVNLILHSHCKYLNMVN